MVNYKNITFPDFLILLNHSLDTNLEDLDFNTKFEFLKRVVNEYYLTFNENEKLKIHNSILNKKNVSVELEDIYRMLIDRFDYQSQYCVTYTLKNELKVEKNAFRHKGFYFVNSVRYIDNGRIVQIVKYH